tara:strand:+ start:581 stop:2818 length:2238 start_codon:yes stop_codon:yes gene_type:complete
MNKFFKYSKKILPFLVVMSFILSIVSCEVDESNEQSAPPLLRVNEAFKYELINSGTSVWIKWVIEDGYYLYRNKLKFKINDTEIPQPILPEGYIHEDEFFGVQQIYRNEVSFEIPYKNQKIIGDEILIEILSQGCADRGICYPPQKWKRTIKIGDNDLNEINAAVNKIYENDSSSDNSFRPYLSSLDQNTIEIAFQIAPNYYLYKNKIRVVPENPFIKMGSIELPKGIIKTDQWFGESEVYYNELFGRVSFSRSATSYKNIGFYIEYQGCLENEICLPPEMKLIDVDFSSVENNSLSRFVPKISEQSRLASLIKSSNLWMVMFTFYFAGILLSFTPCVLPMIPILSGILAGEGKTISASRGFTLAFSYVMGMALVYTAAGIASALIGIQLQAFFNAPWVIIIFTSLFVLFALAMFDVINIELPTSLQTQLSNLNSKFSYGTYAGTFFIGAISSLIVTACVAPPLIASLIVISETGDIYRGGMALFSMSIGMGTPLLIIGTSAGRILPKIGSWMVTIKHLFGYMMLGVAIYMLSRIVDGSIVLGLWGTLAILVGMSFNGLSHLEKNSSFIEKLKKTAGIVLIIYGASLLLGSFSGNNNPMQPLAKLNILQNDSTHTDNHVSFKRIKSLENLNFELTAAANENKPVMLDFYADWCVSCKEMEIYTFTDESVKNALSNLILIQADVTLNDTIDQALMRELDVFGPPTIIFFNRNGRRQKGYEIVGYMKAKEFAEHVNEALNVPEDRSI